MRRSPTVISTRALPGVVEGEETAFLITVFLAAFLAGADAGFLTLVVDAVLATVGTGLGAFLLADFWAGAETVFLATGAGTGLEMGWTGVFLATVFFTGALVAFLTTGAGVGWGAVGTAVGAFLLAVFLAGAETVFLAAGDETGLEMGWAGTFLATAFFTGALAAFLTAGAGAGWGTVGTGVGAFLLAVFWVGAETAFLTAGAGAGFETGFVGAFLVTGFFEVTWTAFFTTAALVAAGFLLAGLATFFATVFTAWGAMGLGLAAFLEMDGLETEGEVTVDEGFREVEEGSAGLVWVGLEAAWAELFLDAFLSIDCFGLPAMF